MMQFTYLFCLLVSIAGLVVIDRRWRLALWHDRRRTVWTIAAACTPFILWDALGIALGIFFHGGSQLTLPIRIAPEFPLEELFFIVLLCYTALILYRGAQLWQRT